eukprot:TRINITY_DN8313_c0_g2_i1.p1 TRINITY_DN8313_c0_g2~~TRINITY_DN8313_c0_g2_i1.p1  ORF type:complete len:178 (-),score=46.62 TRINITY_DN8313_c0_g2_i1:351-884(-)
MIRRPPRSTLSSSSAASDVYKRQEIDQAGAWAQEYAESAWANEFMTDQAADQAVTQPTAAPGPWAAPVQQAPVVPEPAVTFADQFNLKQTEWANEFTDGDALCLNPNPLTGEPGIKHKFTLPNPFQDDENPYDTAMKLYSQGDLQNAIYAFEAELMRNASNEDAKFQLASAIVLAKS